MAKTKQITAAAKAKKDEQKKTADLVKRSKESPKAVGIPGTNPGKAANEARKQGKAEGLRGPALKQRVAQARIDAREAQNADMEKQLGLAPGAMKYVKNPRKFISRILKGKGPAMNRLMMLRQATEDLGYEETKHKQEDYYGQQYDEEGRPVMDWHEESAPGFKEWQQYVQGRIDPETGEVTGLTDKQRADYYGGMHDPIAAQAQQQYGNEMERASAAGIDPRSGMAADRAMAIGAKTQQALAEAGRKTEEANLERMRDTEKYAGDLARLEEQKRSSQTTADVARQGQIEQGMGGLTEMDEKQRQFDVEYTEGQRQAQQRREDAKKAAKEAEPSTFDKVASGIGGFFGGLGGGMGG